MADSITCNSATPPPIKGFWGMPCWNGLNRLQQDRLIEWGNLPLGYKPLGPCDRPAQCCIETQDDIAPGPRFYCYPCAVTYLMTRAAHSTLPST